MPKPIQIDLSRLNNLTPVEKEKYRREGLCPYCREKEHDLGKCHHKSSTSKPHKFRFTSTNLRTEKEIEDFKNNHVQPQ